jgi:hypothetical protein
MSVQEFYIGSVGPLQYDDADIYLDSIPLEGGRFKQIYIEDAPIEDYHVVRNIDLDAISAAVGIAKLATITGVNACLTGQTLVYTVPSAKVMIVRHVIVRVTAFTMGSKTQHAIVSFGANGLSYNDYIFSGTYTIIAAARAICDFPLDPSSPVYAAGSNFKIAIETASNATIETWAVDLFGYLI